MKAAPGAPRGLVALERPVATERPVALKAKPATFFKYAFFAMPEIAVTAELAFSNEFVVSMAKSFTPKKVPVFGVVVSPFAVPPVEVEVALKFAAMMNAGVLCKSGLGKCC